MDIFVTIYWKAESITKPLHFGTIEKVIGT